MTFKATRRLVAVFVLVLLVGVVAACGGTPTATPVPPTATPVPPTATPVPPTATPVPPTATAVPPTAAPTKAPAAVATAAPGGSGTASSGDTAAVVAALNSLAKAQSFGMSIKVDGTSTTIPFTGDIKMEVTQVPTRSIYMKLGDQMEMTMIGEAVYLKLPGQAWQKSPMPQAQLNQLTGSLDFANSIKPEDIAKIQVTKVGSETVNGVDTDVYNVTQPGAAGTSKLWISKSDKKIVQEQIVDGASTITVNFYGWDTIKVPTPTP